MRITFNGAVQTVTGSQHLITLNGQRILLECGLYQGKRDEARKRNRNFPFNPAEIDVLVLSHAHIDHSGNIPNLVRRGFRGKIICTSATVDLCAAMLLDSGHIQEMDVAYVNKKRQQRGEPPVDPIYTQEDASASLKYFQGIDYDEPYLLGPGVTLTLHDAGHLLGSAIVVLDFAEDNGHPTRRLVFSGDLGRTDVPILKDPTLIEEADILLIESTYGGRLHPPIEDSARELENTVRRTYERGGKVIIPAFAVERTQMLVYLLNNLYNQGNLPDMPVFVDSPLAVNATEVFRRHPDCFDQETRDQILRDPEGDIFSFKKLTYIRDVEESKALNDRQGPCVIISASGMAEAGRIQHHLKRNIGDPRNTVLIVGWQAPNTLGRRLVERQPVVRIFGMEYQLEAEVVTLNGFSGHADQQGLLRWVGAFRKRPEQIFVVHGEPEAAQILADHLRRDLGYTRVMLPALHQTFEV
jgi:metallo-beta-lactamase family protein|uniref:MBL fold metallo-hydrolase n=1 Tax=Desulfobacca acetoxidans TaxID=60893 RepID=A0A7V6A4X7_9BACT